jgi:lactoylglutathione lyase
MGNNWRVRTHMSWFRRKSPLIMGNERKHTAGVPRFRGSAHIIRTTWLLRVALMRYLHTMVRVTDLPTSLRFYCDALGLREVRRTDNEKGRFTLVFLAAPGDEQAQIELTWNWDPEQYGIGRAFGHLAYEVDDIYATCQRLVDHGVTINRPPREGRMAFVRSPDNISVELLQKGGALEPREPWKSAPNIGVW